MLIHHSHPNCPQQHLAGPWSGERIAKMFGLSFLRLVYADIRAAAETNKNKSDLQPELDSYCNLFEIDLFASDFEVWADKKRRGSIDPGNALKSELDSKKCKKKKVADGNDRSATSSALVSPQKTGAKAMGGGEQAEDITLHVPEPYGRIYQAATEPASANQAVSPPDYILSSADDTPRDSHIKREQISGLLRLEIITNAFCDRGQGILTPPPPEHLVHLLGIKNLFARALPNMPKEYLSRLVLDHHHKTLALIKAGKIVGGVCFRSFRDQNFLEIVFCAVLSEEQVKGYGTCMMNNLKAYAVVNKYRDFLTYADNRAIGYFEKQGFTKQISMPSARYKGFIKDYDGGLLMQCTVYPQVQYLDLGRMVQMQREATRAEIKKREPRGKRYPGLKAFQEGRSFVPFEEIPGVLATGWKPQQFELSREEPLDKATLAWMKNAVKTLRNHSHAWPFREPVNAEDVPGYYEIIQEPVDLQMVSLKVREKVYTSKEQFIKEVTKMFDNCRKFNTEDSVYFKCADELERCF
jgi:L-amino acid N-acyltransferase YncA